MKSSIVCGPLVALALLAGCAPRRGHAPLLQSVGPAVGATPGAEAPGHLVVFSAFMTVTSALDDGGPRRHSDYTLVDETGKQWRTIRNSSATAWEGPSAVDLPPGRYLVKARANGHGLVTVPVVILPGRTTPVHLEGDGWSGPRPTNAAEAVRLPDGTVIGWRADRLNP